MQNENETSPRLTPEEGQWLVRLARATIAERLGRPLPEDRRRILAERLLDPVFARSCGAFVTLTLEGALRGCIGTLTSSDSLVRNVSQNARNAAFRDPRFPPLTLRELDRIRIEISVLTIPCQLPYADADDLCARIRPGIDGLILRQGGASATFLPQVWKQLPHPRDFLAHLCLKAGLPAQAWRRDKLEVQTYQIQSFEEEHTAETLGRQF